MKKYFNFNSVVALFAATTLFACTQTDIEMTPLENVSEYHHTESNKTSMQIAINELNAFLQQMGFSDVATRSERAFTIDDIICVTNENKTRSILPEVENNVLPDTILYLVNFGDKSEQNGYAVLSANSKEGAIILTVTEKGYISQEDFLFDTEYNYKEDPELKDFDFYNADDDDYYVAGAMGEGNNITHQFLQKYEEGELIVGEIGGATHTTDWECDKTVAPMLTTLWHQHSPFNDACPIQKDGEPALAGCVAVALAQIMAYHELPGGAMTFNGVACNWPDMKAVFPKNPISGQSKYGIRSQRRQVAQFMRNIGSWCNMLYTDSFSFATPRAAQNTMKAFGYENVKRILSYEEEEIVKMLDNGNPVFMAAVSGSVNGHAWVIDGYKRQSRYLKGVKQCRYYFHCSWGWGGLCDGYYLSETFDLRKGAVEADEDEDTVDRNFEYCWRMLTYDNPNN